MYINARSDWLGKLFASRASRNNKIYYQVRLPEFYPYDGILYRLAELHLPVLNSFMTAFIAWRKHGRKPRRKA